MPETEKEKYPEHVKLAAVKQEAETVQQFLDWLLDHHMIHVEGIHEVPLSTGEILGNVLGVLTSKRRKTVEEFLEKDCQEIEVNENSRFFLGYLIKATGETVRYTSERERESLMAAFFNIDLRKLEEEKQAMLDEIRAAHIKSEHNGREPFPGDVPI